MKPKYILILPVFVLLLASLSCGRESPSTTPGDQNPSVGIPTTTTTPDLVISGPCANVLFPFVVGRQWIYQKKPVSGDGTATATPDPITSKFGITVVEENGNQVILDAVDLGTGATTHSTANCQDEAIIDFPLMTLGSLFGNYLNGDIQVTYVSGLFAPSKADLDASSWNMQWQGEYIAAGSVVISAEGESTTITMNESAVHLAWQNAGQETVTVPAGTFENAYKVTRTSDLDVSIDVEGMNARGTLTIETTHWFAPYVGLLRTEVTSAHLSALGISFPIEATGSSVELFEFLP
jgi:hypothetical protein